MGWAMGGFLVCAENSLPGIHTGDKRRLWAEVERCTKGRDRSSQQNEPQLRMMGGSIMRTRNDCS
jgi:hypothetical protein